MQGFKSFAGKIELDFIPGVTAVVGPNGSGKSNVVDAIRWVLGEQSVKNLRGLKMNDVIFSGSESLRPIGMAQVVLVLDNSQGLFPLDYEEISIARRLYRSGESEYLLNKTACRLKDIHELFLDTGLGKEGFSIIGQGKIDEILSVKPEDRRNIIEEAAGISKYRYRKKEATRKLEATDSGMVRIKDIVNELDSRVIPLREQAEKTISHGKLAGELRELEIMMAATKLIENKEKENSLRIKIKNSSDELIYLETAYHTSEAELVNKRTILQKNNQNFIEKKEILFQEKSEKESFENENKILEERAVNFAERIERANLLLNDSLDQFEKLSKRKEEQQNNLDERAASFEEIEERINILNSKINEEMARESDRKKNVEYLKEKMYDLLQNKARENNNIISRRSTLLIKEKALVQLKEKLNESNEKKLEIEHNINELEIEKSNFSDRLLADENIIKMYISKVAELRSEKEACENKKTVLEKNSSEAESRYKILCELERQNEGYNYGTRNVLELRDGSNGIYKGIIGSLAEIIKVTKEYELAIETALGNSLQNVIVENEKIAAKIIDYLKKEKKGRVTFLPLNIIKGKRIEKLPEHSGVVGIASDLIDCADEYRPIIDSFLGKVIVMRSLNEAIDYGKITGFSYRLVTLGGEIINNSGAMTGGNFASKKTGLLTRKREVEELKNKMEKLQDEIMIFDEKVRIIKEKLNLQEEINEELVIKKDKHIEYIRETELTIREKAAELQRTERQMEEIKRNIHEHEEEIYIANNELAASQKNFAVLTEEEEKINVEISILKNEIEGESLKAGFEKELNELKIVYAKEKQIVENLRNRNEELLALVNDEQTKKDMIINEIKEYEELRAKTLEKIRIMKQTSINKHKEIMEKENEIEKIRRMINEVEQEIVLFEKNAKKSLEKLEEKRNEHNRIEVALARINTELEGLYEKIEQELEIEIEDILKRYNPVNNTRSSREKMNFLRKEIEKLGPINFSAVEEHLEVTLRLAFLENQLIDLETARYSLEKVIFEMDQIMRKSFDKTFGQVNEKFNKVFQEIFGGGRAWLELTDTEDLLESGIEIFIQPPNKKMQTLSLLSGGERALTAITLLFALLEIKPSPFYILDEIDAALDEANVQKFSAYLRKISKRAQFIIVSHRRGTMEIADALYGITLEESGVSCLASVRLDEDCFIN